VVKTLPAALAAALFIPAMVGLLYQAVQPHPWPHRLLAIALLLSSLEQAHMARIDLHQVALAEGRVADPRLAQFRQVVALTVTGQVVGFSIAALGHLGWGMALILISLVGFNLAAPIRLILEEPVPIQAADWRSRLTVLALDGIALGLALLWIAQRAQPWVAGGLFAITLTYGGSKLWTYGAALRSQALPTQTVPPSAIHIAHTAEEHPQPPQQN
jgi:hypothetical protein